MKKQDYSHSFLSRDAIYTYLIPLELDPSSGYESDPEPGEALKQWIMRMPELFGALAIRAQGTGKNDPVASYRKFLDDALAVAGHMMLHDDFGIHIIGLYVAAMAAIYGAPMAAVGNVVRHFNDNVAEILDTAQRRIDNQGEDAPAVAAARENFMEAMACGYFVAAAYMPESMDHDLRLHACAVDSLCAMAQIDLRQFLEFVGEYHVLVGQTDWYPGAGPVLLTVGDCLDRMIAQRAGQQDCKDDVVTLLYADAALLTVPGATSAWQNRIGDRMERRLSTLDALDHAECVRIAVELFDETFPPDDIEDDNEQDVMDLRMIVSDFVESRLDILLAPPRPGARHSRSQLDMTCGIA